MAGQWDGKNKRKKADKPEWCSFSGEITDKLFVYVKMNKKYRCPECGKRLKPTFRGNHCFDDSCVEYNTHARFPRHKVK